MKKNTLISFGVESSWRRLRKPIIGMCLVIGSLSHAIILGAQTPTTTTPPATGQLPLPSPAGAVDANGVPIADPAGAVRINSAALASEYSRQVFTYPKEGRPDPVQPPPSLGTAANEENLSVAGIIMNAKNPRLSKAMIRAKGFGKSRYAVMSGDKIDQYKVIEVRPSSVVLSVPVLGGNRTLILQRSRDQQLSEGTRGGTMNSGDGSKTVVTEIPGQSTKGPVEERQYPQPRPAKDSLVGPGVQKLPLPIRRDQ